MAFSENIRRKEIERANSCEICNDPFRPDSYIEVHSVTSLHLERRGNKYLVTDPTKGHEFLKGRLVDLNIYKPGEEKLSDGVCLCPVCHDEIKRIALAESRYRNHDFKGNAPSPKVLEEVTMFFVDRKRPIVYDYIEAKSEIQRQSHPSRKIVLIFNESKITFA